MDIFAEINAGKYRNALPYARPKEDRAVFDAYQAEVARLNALFVDDLRQHLAMEPGPAFDALFALAWEKGHSSGFSEVANEAEDAAGVLKVGAAAERARIRREWTTEIDLIGERQGGTAERLQHALDRICPEP